MRRKGVSGRRQHVQRHGDGDDVRRTLVVMFST